MIGNFACIGHFGACIGHYCAYHLCLSFLPIIVLAYHSCLSFSTIIFAYHFLSIILPVIFDRQESWRRQALKCPRLAGMIGKFSFVSNISYVYLSIIDHSHCHYVSDGSKIGKARETASDQRLQSRTSYLFQR